MSNKKNIRIALAGNPNSGKTTLFNALTGSNQFVGNWPGVTVEKKEGKLKGNADVTVTDLPGIYSLSPYTLEEVVARNYLVDERPDVILNIVDGTNIERNLYLTTQLIELGIPVVVAINMMDVVNKKGDKIDISRLSATLGCKVVEISALKGAGIEEASRVAIESVGQKSNARKYIFSGIVEHAIAHIEEATVHDMPEERQRWYAVKIFERDAKVIEALGITPERLAHIEKDISEVEKVLDDDAESIITNERYLYVDSVLKHSYNRKNAGELTTSDKIDKVITNRWLALPIFAAIMVLIYYISVSTVGAWATDWMNDGVFGDGFHLFGIGSSAHEEAVLDYAVENIWTEDVITVVNNASSADITGADEIAEAIENKDFGAFEEAYASYGEALSDKGYDLSALIDESLEGLPSADEFGVWVHGIPVLIEKGLDAVNCVDWLESLILDGIVGGVGAVLGFVPQMLMLFLFLAFLEACGYMSRIAFIMDRLFRKFGLSGKSFIPMLIGTGCSVPGIMASRTIENDRDRKMTIITTSFIPCGAKLPVIALIASALFNGAWWVAPIAYFIGAAAVIVSGIILKKTKLFSGDVAPFVMELPSYHMPTLVNLLRSMWDRGWSFIKKAGTVILLASVIVWGGARFGILDGGFTFSLDMPLESSVLGMIGNAISYIFLPLGFGNIKAAIATIMGLVAKEEIVGVFGVLDFEGMGKLAGFSFLLFNLLCAPCFAAMGAIRREMNSAKWTVFAISYQCVLAYLVSLVVYQVGSAFVGNLNVAGIVAAAVIILVALYLIFRPNTSACKGNKKLKN